MRFGGKLGRFWDLSARKIRLVEREYDSAQGSPVFTMEGRYTARGWTEWTQGFQYGAEILQFDATGEASFLDAGRRHTREKMAPLVLMTDLTSLFWLGPVDSVEALSAVLVG